MVIQCVLYFQASIAAAQVSSSSPTVTLVQLPNGQTVQVHGVIQAAQPSVIQSPQVQTVQVRGEGKLNLASNDCSRGYELNVMALKFVNEFKLNLR